MAISDIQIRGGIQAILARHCIDQGKLKFDCCKGVVRFRGILALGERATPLDPDHSLFESLEHEVRRVAGVKKVYLMNVKLGV
jgi:hypothetical protein